MNHTGDGMMDVYDLILAILYYRRGEDLGRAAVQSLGYLATRLIPVSPAPSFTMQYGGPYSETLGLVFERLVWHSFVTEYKSPGAQEAYSYSVSPDGTKIVQDGLHAAERDPVKSMMDRCRESCGFDSEALSQAATILYLAGQEACPRENPAPGAGVLKTLGLYHD